MTARTSPPSAPRRLRWLAIGVNASVSGCFPSDVPDEPALVEETSPERVSAVAPPPWHPPLESGRYFNYRDPRNAGTGSGPSESQGVPPPPIAMPSEEPPPEEQASGSSSLRDAGPRADPNDRPVVDAAVPDAAAAPPACSGHELFGICWYLGEPGASCEQTCASHGEVDAAASAHVGTTQQGGSPQDCVLILNALAARYQVRVASRDEMGVGCHLSGADSDPYWLSRPAFEPTACLSGVRIVCGCRE
jgi:hypothetical protein